MTATTTEQFDVMNRWTGEVAFTATIETTPEMTRGWKLRLAVAWALASSVPCNSLVLDGADFTGYRCPVRSSFDGSSFDGSSFVRSSFVGSSFVGSSFVGSSFDGSSFDGSSFDGSSFVRSSFVGSSFVGEADAKADFMQIMAWAEPEIPALIEALESGRVNGSVYTGECACLVGTIANVRGVNVNDLERDSSRPAERWFLMISKGDTPGDQSPGAYAAARAVEWANEYLATAKATTTP